MKTFCYFPSQNLLVRRMSSRRMWACFLLLGIAACHAFARVPLTAPGDSASVLILSDRVGPVIDAEEAAQYHIFSQIKGLVEARVVELADSSTAVVVTLTRARESRVDSLVFYTENTLKMIAEKIDHFESFSDGAYVMGSQPVSIRHSTYRVPVHVAAEQHTWAQVLVPVPTSQVPQTQNRAVSQLRAAERSGYPRERAYPVFAIGFGVRTYSPDTKGLQQTTGSFSYGGLITVGVEIVISRSFGIQAEGGGTTENEGRYASIGPVIYLPVFSNPGISPFLGGGLAWTSSKGGGNGLLLNAGAKGYYFTGGVEFNMGIAAAFDIFGSYLGFRKVSTTFQDIWASSVQNPGTPPANPASVPAAEASMNFSHFTAGIRLKLFL
jgi:hypothetical protein